MLHIFSTEPEQEHNFFLLPNPGIELTEGHQVQLMKVESILAKTL